MVEPNGRRGLKCKKSRGRRCGTTKSTNRSREASTLEPKGQSRKSDNKRPDGYRITTWKNGKCLIWDFTCVDTFCKNVYQESFYRSSWVKIGSNPLEIKRSTHSSWERIGTNHLEVERSICSSWERTHPPCSQCSILPLQIIRFSKFLPHCKYLHDHYNHKVDRIVRH